MPPVDWPAQDAHRDVALDPVRWRPGTAAAVAVAVLVLLAAAAVALSGDRTPDPSNAAGLPAAPLRAPVSPAAGGPLPDDAAPAGPLLTAPSVSWELVTGVAVPVSATAGPHAVVGPVHAGFERSQTGALLAAAQISTRSVVTSGDGWRDVVARQVLPGAGRDVYSRLRALVDADAPPGTYGQFAGFRIIASTPDVAVVQLVTRFGADASEALQVMAVTVKWVEGDWRLELQPDGGISPTGQLVSDLDGFVVWGGM